MSRARAAERVGDLFWRQVERALTDALTPFEHVDFTDDVRAAAIEAATRALVDLENRALPPETRGTPEQIRSAIEKCIDIAAGRRPRFRVIKH